MKHTLSLLALSLAFCAPLAAQKMGSTNSDAPTLNQAFATKDGSVDFKVEYTAITWADGQTMARLMDKEKGEGMRTRVNGSAPKAPLASLTTKHPIEAGGQTLPAGVYSIYFTIADDLTWRLNAQHEEDASVSFQWRLKFQQSDAERTRLAISVNPADDANEASISIAFGSMVCSFEIEAGEADGQDEVVEEEVEEASDKKDKD